MGRRASRRLVAALLLVALALTVFGLGRFLSHKGLDWAVKFSDIASFVIAAVGLLVAPAGKIAQWLRGPHPPTLEEISAAKSSLHSALSAMWREDRPDAYLDLPMQVRFVATTKFVSTHLASNHPGGTQDEQRLDGDVGSVVDAFAQKPRFRRVILGPAGAGKTVLVTELQRSLLDAQASSDPLPVIVPVASWEPVRESLLDWLAKQLSADYALLTEERARALVASGSVLPILDGLDEMPIAMRPDAIARINEHGVHRPLVVTSRDDEYRAAARVCQTEIRGAATVVVEPLLPADIRAYLEPTGPERWSKVLDEVDANPGEVLATALGNPLMLWLARVVYQDKSPDGLASFDSRAAIEDHLLKEFVPAVYRNHSSSQMSGRFRCSAAQAKWWLSHLPRNGGGDATTMAWWQFGSAAGRWRLLGILMRGAILLSAAAVLVVWLLEQQGNWHDGAYAGPINLTDLLLGGPLGRLIRPTVHQLALALPKHTGSGAQAVISTSFRAIGEIIINPFYLALATLAFVIFGFYRLSYAIPNTPRRIQIRITRILINTIGTYSFIFFSATALSYLLLTSFHRHTSVAAFFGARSTWISLATIALIGLTTLPSTFIQRSDISGNLSPRQSGSSRLRV